MPGVGFGWSFVRSYTSAGATGTDLSGEQWFSNALDVRLRWEGTNIALYLDASHKRVFAGNGMPGTAYMRPGISRPRWNGPP